METKVENLKVLLVATSIMEGGTGLALMFAPSFLTNLLLGSPLVGPVGIFVTRVGGSALVALGIACWFLRKSESAGGLIIALLFYNLASVVLLVNVGLFENLNGVVLWSVVVLHVVMALWCAKSLGFSNKIKSLT